MNKILVRAAGIFISLAVFVFHGPPSVSAATCTWTGAVNSDWQTAGNWSGCSGAPSSVDDADIPTTGVTNDPTISGADVTIRHLTIRSGRTLTMASGRTLSLSGNLSRSGAFVCSDCTVVFNAVGAQTIGNAMTGSNAFNNVTIQSGANVSTGNSLEVTGNWTVDGAFSQSAGTTTFSAATHNLSGNGSSQFNNLISSGATINAGGSNFLIRGDWTHGTAGTFNADTSSVTFNGSVNQSQPAIARVPALYNMTVDKSGGTMSTRRWTVGNNFLLTQGTIEFSTDSSFKNVTLNGGTLTAPTGNITVSGNWTNNGTFTAGSGTVTFNGVASTSTLQIFTGNTTFNNLAVNSGAIIETGISLMTVNGTYTNNGQIRHTPTTAVTDCTSSSVSERDATNNSALTLSSCSGGSGFTGATIKSAAGYGFPNVDIGLSLRYDSCPASGNMVRRYWEITPNGSGADRTATVTFLFRTSEQNGNTGNLNVYKCVSGAWQQVASGLAQTTASTPGYNQVTATGLAIGSAYGLGGGAPTAVKLSSFVAYGDAGGNVPVWGLILAGGAVVGTAWQIRAKRRA